MKYFSIIILLISASMTCCKSETTQKNNSEGTVFLNELQNQKIIDLTYSFSNKSIYWVTAKEFELQVVAQGQTDKGFYYAANNFSTAEHGGTHIDAPRHFYETGQTVDQIPLFNLIGNAIKVNVVHNTKNNPDYQVSIDDFKNWEQQHNQPIPNGSIVIIETGFGAFYPDKQKYLGTVNRGPEAVKELHFPGLSPEGASWLITERNIKAVGLDTPSIDYGQSQDFKSHVILMSKNIPVFENVANVEQLPARGFQIIALPIKIEGGSGGPLRIIAILDEQAPYY